ncbi:CoA transferase [Burkholderia cenocepacia]|uniref:CaiB/BaiF CoA transferase family protein n=1 Tax=Burkholderia cepacia complex TaxID=87882 RepID=UPI000F56B3F0|nr:MULTISPECIES: CaiB/BaiF CoA-transferase family protein [Burkholderia cepacia complex]ELW9450227.1 CoA transferase [Burkholderia cenocepacia]MBR8484860.1 CoA transferase [Burkholderia cenocepacia]MDN7468294.1 CaiB/BaiF CoA-transferase family protein [Burkholderia orbicola]MDN7505285.1 CaiB/BaiF CoA-transferase family protein [Burkholderia orbicola]RQU21424.1 CoA transferase [Burkholderia cenocepacia]
MTNELRALPLAGVKVLDFSRVLAGPWCAMVLADFGAEVIKVEHPARGDDTRDWGLRIGDTETTYFNSVNRSKRSICVDLQTEAGQRIARELAAQADVLIHNFKFGGAEKLGLGYDTLAELNPRLVHCAISGYDRSGAEAARPGYDLVVQGEAGLMALNGEAGQPPLKFGVAAVDLFTGMYSAQAILAALYERHATGRGRRIEMALFDCGLMITAYYGLDALLMGEDPPRYGNAHPSIVPYGVFDAADGPLVITVGNNTQFARFCDAIERPDLAADERYKTNLGRSENRADLLPEIRRELARRSRATLLAALADAGIPCGEVLGLHEALTSERATRAGLVTRQPHPVAGAVDVLAPPYRFDGTRLPVRGAPPVLGADTDAVLGGWLGMSAEDVARLRADRVV